MVCATAKCWERGRWLRCEDVDRISCCHRYQSVRLYRLIRNGDLHLLQQIRLANRRANLFFISSFNARIVIRPILCRSRIASPSSLADIADFTVECWCKTGETFFFCLLRFLLWHECTMHSFLAASLRGCQRCRTLYARINNMVRKAPHYLTRLTSCNLSIFVKICNVRKIMTLLCYMTLKP